MSQVIMSSLRLCVACCQGRSKNMTSIFFIQCTVYDKTITRFGLCDIQNNQGLSKGYQPLALADNPYLDVDYSGYHKNVLQ